MAYQSTTANALGLEASTPWARAWVALLRVVTGWWFFHAGVTKLIEDGLAYTYGPIYLKGMTGTALGPLPMWMGENLGPFVEAMVPLGETLIGLGLIVGALVRLASLFGMVFMTMFWVGNADFGHGLVNADLMGLLLFGTMIALGAGRYYGLDGIVERLEFVKRRPRLRCLLG